MFQPVGGMDMISKAFAREVGEVIDYNRKVTAIRQDDAGVVVTHDDSRGGQSPRQARADWCVCTIPLSILSQIETNFSPSLTSAIAAVPYSPSVKVGMQFKRRFWEEDEAIYGGVSYTDLPNTQIGYPSNDYLSGGPAVALAAYSFGVTAIEQTAMAPAERVRSTLEHVARIHPQATREYDGGIGVGWHRNPASLGCFGLWKADTRQRFYKDIRAMDGARSWRENIVPTSMPGRKGLSCPRSTRSGNCIAA